MTASASPPWFSPSPADRLREGRDPEEGQRLKATEIGAIDGGSPTSPDDVQDDS